MRRIHARVDDRDRDAGAPRDLPGLADSVLVEPVLEVSDRIGVRVGRGSERESSRARHGEHEQAR